MSNTQNPLYRVIHKLVYIGQLIVATPNCGGVIILQFMSGAFNFAGLPMLIPVLDYLKDGAIATTNEGYLSYLEKGLRWFGLEPNFYNVLIIAFLLIITAQLLVFTSALIASRAQAELSKQYRKKIFNAYGKADWLKLIDSRSGEVSYSVIKEADICGVAHLNAQRVLIYSIQILFLMAVAIKISLAVTLMAMGVYSFLAFVNGLNSRQILQLGRQYNQQERRLANEMTVLQQNKKFFKTSLLNSKIIQSIFILVDDIANIIKKEVLRIEIQHTWSLLFSFVFLLSMMLFHRQLSLGYSELLLILMIFLKIGPHFATLSTAFATLDSQIPIYEALQNRLNELNDNIEENGTKEFNEDQAIKFNNVSFIYPNGTQVFNKLNLIIEPKKATAFVGGSGEGKSTLLDLILGLLKPSEGAIQYGDISHDQLDKKSLRSKIAYVSQETTLVDGTLLENITIRGNDAPDVRVQNIVERVGLTEVVNGLTDGLKTQIGENGVKLSGGQRQRVALARALFMDPKILILDEATSSLDAESALLIQETIKKLKYDFTIIIVTHKLSAVRFADQIYVLEKGKVCESGSYQELLAQEGKLHFFDSLQ